MQEKAKISVDISSGLFNNEFHSKIDQKDTVRKYFAFPLLTFTLRVRKKRHAASDDED